MEVSQADKLTNRIIEAIKVLLFVLSFGATLLLNFDCTKDSSTSNYDCGAGGATWDGKYPNNTCRDLTGKAVDSRCCGG